MMKVLQMKNSFNVCKPAWSHCSGCSLTTQLLRQHARCVHSTASSTSPKHDYSSSYTTSATRTSTGKPASTTSSENRMPSRANDVIDRILRVNHAGELGADRIYAGQMLVLRNTSVGPTIQHMWDEEKNHLAEFKRLIPKHRARPTALLPVWNVAGYMLGASTALLGKNAAMACTVAVEEVIGSHYNNQIRQLFERYPKGEQEELLNTIKKFRDDELGHMDIGLKNDAETAPAFKALKFVIQTGCRGAIWLSERV